MKLTTIINDPGFPTRTKTVLQGIADDFDLGPILRPSDIKQLVLSGRLKLFGVRMCGVKMQREIGLWAKCPESGFGYFFKQCPHCGKDTAVPK